MHETYKKWLDDEKPKLICECGCGQEITITKYHPYDGIPKYIVGHRMHNSYKKWLDDGCPKVYCQCGCNQEIIVKEFYHRWDGIPEYILNHRKKRKPLSKKHRQKLSEVRKGENNPNYNNHKLIGDKNPNWKGGISFLPYCLKFNKKLREEIKNRDNRICQLCGKNKEENNNRELSVHHIHYDKENCYPDLITLCVSCNSKVNSNRDYWEKYFMEKLKERKLLNYFGDK